MSASLKQGIREGVNRRTISKMAEGIKRREAAKSGPVIETTKVAPALEFPSDIPKKRDWNQINKMIEEVFQNSKSTLQSDNALVADLKNALTVGKNVSEGAKEVAHAQSRRKDAIDAIDNVAISKDLLHILSDLSHGKHLPDEFDNYPFMQKFADKIRQQERTANVQDAAVTPASDNTDYHTSQAQLLTAYKKITTLYEYQEEVEEDRERLRAKLQASESSLHSEQSRAKAEKEHLEKQFNMKLQESIRLQENEARSHADKVQKLKNQLTAAQNAKEQISKDMKSKSRTCTLLARKRQLLKKQRRPAKARDAHLNHLLQEQNSTIDCLEQQVSTQSNNIEQKRAIIADLNDQRASSQEMIQGLHNHSSYLIGTVQSQTRHMEQLRRKLDSKFKLVEDQADQLVQSRQAMQRLQLTFESKSSLAKGQATTLVELYKSKQDMQLMLDAQALTIGQQELHIAEAQQIAQARPTTSQTHQLTIASLQGQNDVAQSRLYMTQSQTYLAQIRTNLTQSQMELAKSRADLTQSQAALAESQTALAQSQADLAESKSFNSYLIDHV